MAFGINAPYGLKPHSYLNGATWNGATMSFPILSGAANPIYYGDPVCFDATYGAANLTSGGIRAATTVTDLAAATVPYLLGVFVGCRYRQTVGGMVQEFNSNFYPGAVTTSDGGPIEAFVVCDPNVLFDVQCSTSAGATATAYFGAAAGAIGNNAYLGLGITGPGVAGAAFPAGVVYPNGNSLQQNPTSGSVATGMSAVYLDIGTTTGAGAVTGKGNTVARTQCKIVALTPRIDNFNNMNTPIALANNYATAVGINTAVNPNQVSVGSFNNVLVRLNFTQFGNGTPTAQ